MEKITIEKEEGGTFVVSQGERDSGSLGYDEMLGLISALIMPESRPCLNWMKTKEEKEAYRKYIETLGAKNGNVTEVDFEETLP